MSTPILKKSKKVFLLFDQHLYGKGNIAPIKPKGLVMFFHAYGERKTLPAPRALFHLYLNKTIYINQVQNKW